MTISRHAGASRRASALAFAALAFLTFPTARVTRQIPAGQPRAPTAAARSGSSAS